MKNTVNLLIILLTSLLFAGCTSIPDQVTPVSGFETQRYLGKWYEIARLDHSFEEGLSNVTAEYVLREDGGIDVINRGYATEEQAWDEALGTAYFVDSEDTAHLKVSFFGPFYSSYVVFALNDRADNYEYAFVSGYKTDFLWLLARTPTVDQALIDEFKQTAKTKGFPVEELILVDQQRNI